MYSPCEIGAHLAGRGSVLMILVDHAVMLHVYDFPAFL